MSDVAVSSSPGAAGDAGFAARYLADIAVQFRAQKAAAEKALAQVDDAAFFHAPDAESNSLALIVKHVGGNLRSRWTDFLTADGEKPDRDRDGEFEVRAGEDRAALMGIWERGWSALFGALAGLGPRDVEATVTIRREAMPAMVAIHRSLAHTASHVGQIVWLAKHLAGASWSTLSIPRGRSADYDPTRR